MLKMQFEYGYYILFMKNANSVHKNNTFLYIFTKPRLLNIVFLSLFPFIFLSKFKKYINFVVDVNICCTFQHIQLINVIFTYQTYRPHKQCLFMSALSNAKIRRGGTNPPTLDLPPMSSPKPMAHIQGCR